MGVWYGRIYTVCCYTKKKEARKAAAWQFNGRRIENKWGQCLAVQGEDGRTLRASRKYCGRNRPDNRWTLNEKQIIAPLMPTHTKSMCVGVRGGTCGPYGTVMLKPCDDATGDLNWKASIIDASGQCAAAKVPPEKEPEPPLKGECTLTLYEEYGFRNFVASYGNGKFHTRKLTGLLQLSSGAYTNRTQSELMQLDADDDDDDYNGEEEGDEASEALREKVRNRIAQELLMARRKAVANSSADSFLQQQLVAADGSMDGTLMKKDGRHTSDIGSWKLAGPVGCEVLLYSEKNLEGSQCKMTIDENDGYNNQPYDDVVQCEDMELCCPFKDVSSVEVKFNAQVAKTKKMQAATR
jgi:hypothetical protein